MKRSNIAEFGSETEVAIPDSAIRSAYLSITERLISPADAAGKNIRKVGVATCMTLRISFGGNTFADKGNGLFVFQSGGIFVQAFGFPFFEPCLFFQLHFSFDGSFIFFDISFHLSDFGVVAVLFE